MLVLYFGLVDVTNLLSANRRVTLTSSTIADLVTQASGNVSSADLDGFFNAAYHIERLLWQIIVLASKNTFKACNGIF